MEKEQFIDKIFETENDAHLMSFKTSGGIPVWLMGKYFLMFNVLSSRVLHYKASIRHRKISIKTFKLLLKSVFYNFGKRKLKKNKEIILWSVNRKTLIDGKYFNRYVDLFAEMFPDNSYIIEEPLLDWEWPFKRFNNDVYFNVTAKIKSELFARFFAGKYYAVVSQMLEYYLVRVKNILGLEFTDREVISFKKYISRQIYAMKYMSKWLERRLTDKTKIVLMVGAAFPHNYPINVMLKKHGVKSVELQHGYITSTNVMYNYAKNILDCGELKNGMPDYMLTYGNWWNTQVNCPVEKIAVGNPYHDYCFDTLINSPKTEKRVITILGCNQNTEHYVKLVDFLSKSIIDFVFKFRPHPGEQREAKSITESAGYNINFDTNLDIYDTLKESYAVIGEVTTVLFEAIGLVERIIVWETDYTKAFMPEHPFERFKNSDELINLFYKSDNRNYSNSDFWAQNWRDKYRQFINNILNN